MLRRFMDWLYGRRYSDHFVDTSVGRVRFYQLTNGMQNRVNVRSTVNGEVKNNALAFMCWDRELVALSNKEYNRLTIKDGNLVRQKVKDILIEHDIIRVGGLDDLTHPEQDQMNKMFLDAKKKIEMMNQGGVNA